MPNNNSVHINKWLLPVSWLYGIVIFIRNKFFDWGLLKQKKYDIPVISVGNITVGGTGKTPHIEYLIHLLKTDYNVAVLSRGYKRKTKGFILADTDSTVSQIGDEPYQIKLKFPQITIAVDSKRQRGIELLLALPADKRPDLILLDDAFQHRYVKPSYSMLLTDYNRLMSYDKLLPAGRLREPVYFSEYANMIVVTKCPQTINPLEQRIIIKEINPYPYQTLMFTYFDYGNIVPVFANDEPVFTLKAIKNKSVLVVTGIANPKPLHEAVKRFTSGMETLSYPDHYNFKRTDIQKIKSVFDSIKGENKLILVTEKDAAKLRSMKKLDEELKKYIYYIPVQVKFVNKEDKEIFNHIILNHVAENS
ncbi:MAG TPA: tetraacyldisaccharide 4'-kinase [Dysgonomonas sp.]|nr:tetraacyldisaccharide 4'-kinase [Dysgonomonas sp.]